MNLPKKLAKVRKRLGEESYNRLEEMIKSGEIADWKEVRMKELEKQLLREGAVPIVTKPKTPREVIEEQFPQEMVISTPTEKVPVSWRRNFDRLKEMQAAWREVYPFQEVVDVKVESEYPHLPHLFAWMSDEHAGALGQSPKLAEHLDMIIATPNTSMVGVGDIIDFGMLARFEVRWMQGLPVPIQTATIKDLLEELTIPDRNPRKKKILKALVAGNHTATLFENSGVLWESFLAEVDLPMIPGMGKLNIQVGEEQYEVAVAHKYWGNSRLNKTLSGKRLIEYVYMDADAAIVGHQHWKACEIFSRGGRRRVIQRPGHYRTETPYFEQMRGYHEPGNEGASCALFYPDKHYIEPFDDIEEGIARMVDLFELDGLRKALKDINKDVPDKSPQSDQA